MESIKRIELLFCHQAYIKKVNKKAVKKK